MTTLYERAERLKRPWGNPYKIDFAKSGADRRVFRRHDMEQRGITVSRWAGGTRSPESFGRIIDLSAGGVRIRTTEKDVRTDGQIRVRLELPAYAGISPFVDATAERPRPKREWVGWMSVARVMPAAGGEHDVAGQLLDMDEVDRGMLGLYLSTQPIAA